MFTKTPRAGIIGLGTCLPTKVLNNAALEKMVDTTDEWIRTRTGILERRIAAKGQTTSDLAASAGAQAIQNAGLTAADIDLIIVGTISPDMMFPATACIVQNKLGAKNAVAFDLNAACSGFVYAFVVAAGLLESGRYKHALVIGAEVLSGFIDWTDRSTCVLFGDGAGAAVVTCTKDGSGLLAHYLATDGSGVDLLKMPGGGSACPPSVESIQNRLHFLKMDGKEVFKFAVRSMSDAVFNVLERAHLKIDDIDCLIPHQANLRIISAVQDRTGIPTEKVFLNVQKYGNMSGASAPVALAEAVSEGHIRKGSNVVLVAFGSGLTWGACALRW